MKKITSTGSGLLIGIPTLGRPLTLDWAMAFKSLTPPINYNSVHMIIKGKPVDEARELIAEHALANGHKYIFFLGDDVIVPNPTLRQLIYRMEQDPDLGVVGGVYCSKSDPPAPLVFRGNGEGTYWDWKIGEYFEVTGMGMDCTLIRTDVFKKLSKPWFKTVDTDQFKDAINQAQMWTEDLFMLEKLAKETNYKIYCDASIICGHVDVYADKVYNLPSKSLPMRNLATDDKPKALDIGCGPIDRSNDFPNHNLIRVDIRDECNPDYRCDVRDLPFADGEFDLIFSSHVLEHFSREGWKAVFAEWLRVLKVGGEVFLILPNIEWATTHFDESAEQANVMNVLYGAQSNPFDFHYNGWTPKSVNAALHEFGCAPPSISHSGYNMIIKSKKLR